MGIIFTEKHKKGDKILAGIYALYVIINTSNNLHVSRLKVTRVLDCVFANQSFAFSHSTDNPCDEVHVLSRILKEEKRTEVDACTYVRTIRKSSLF